jgi:hypothetical protein
MNFVRQSRSFDCIVLAGAGPADAQRHRTVRNSGASHSALSNANLADITELHCGIGCRFYQEDLINLSKYKSFLGVKAGLRSAAIRSESTPASRVIGRQR